MLRNYLIVAWRNIVRHKGYSAINVLGLAIGIAFCILSFLFIRHEWSFDTFHPHADRIYLAYPSGDRDPAGSTPPILTPTLRAYLPEIDQVVRVHGWDTRDGIPVQYGDKSFTLSGFRVDPEFFEMFSFPRIAGDLQTALREFNSVVISRRTASLVFGEEDPLGRRLSLKVKGRLQDGVVTGVVEVPRNSSLQFDFLLPYRESFSPGDWGGMNVYTFVQLPASMQPADLEKKFEAFFESYFEERKNRGVRFFGGPEERLRLLPLRDLYLNTLLRDWPILRSQPVYSYALAGIALAVLLIACINFINLSLGLSSTRSKEIGVRKVLGARRIHLVKQFWGEALVLSLAALLLGVALAELFLPVFEGLTQRDLSLDYAAVWPALAGITLGVGLMTGSYPALVLSRFQPVEVMRGWQRLGSRGWFSRGLLLAQFALSIALIAVTLTMRWQVAFMRKLALGFNAEQVVVIEAGGSYERWYGELMGDPRSHTKEERRQIHEEIERRVHAEKDRLLGAYRQTAAQHPGILSVSMANMSFGRGNYWGTDWADDSEGEVSALRTHMLVRTYVVDYDYLKTLQIELVAGRDLSPAFSADEKESILVNETLVQNIFGEKDPLGKEIPFSKRERWLQGRIIGVVRDSHIKPLQQALEPALFRLRSGNGELQYLLVRLSPKDITGTLALLKETWEQVAPDKPFVFTFLDQDVERTFREDERWMEITRYAALFALFVACLGTFGLTSLAVARRTKEIGIRKVLGASVPSIVALLSKEFTYLVLAATVLAWPFAYFIMSEWLQNFAYRIDQGAGAAILGGVLALGIAWLTVSYQAIRAARANPVEALRYE